MPALHLRRRFLQRLGTAITIGLAGCTSGGNRRGRSTTVDADPTEVSTSGPDERETRTPPGSPPLDPNGEWPQYRFDAGNTGYNPDGPGLREGEGYWRLAPCSEPSVSGGTLFNSGDDGPSLARRDPATAAVHSQTSLERGPIGPPAVVNDRVYVTSFQQVTCLAADRDDALWEGPAMDGIKSNPTVQGETVFVNTDGHGSIPPQVRAFDATTGEETWRYDTDSRSWSTPAVANGSVFVNTEEGLHVIDVERGERTTLVAETSNLWATPAVAEGTVFVMSRQDEGVELVTVDATDGTIRWRFDDVARTNSPPVIAEDLVYVETQTSVVALDAADGNLAFELEGPGNPVARTGDVLYATHDGRLVAFDAEEGQELWSYATEQVQIDDTIGRTIHGIAPVDGAVYVAARDAFHGIGPGSTAD